jgi:hypothetical protein
MAADERVRCAVPVAGLADMLSHVSEGYPGRLRDGVVAGHCDCMYFNNTYRWDFTQVIALCAPRPVLLGNSDRDDIFPVPGYRRPAAKAKRIYELYGAGDRFALLETAGPHKDTPELRRGEFRWMNRWLKGEKGEVGEPKSPKLAPKRLKVFDRLPADSINDVAHERFLRPARLSLPDVPAVAREWWKGKAPQLRRALRERVFRGWPKGAPPTFRATPRQDVRADGLRLRAFVFESEPGVELGLWVLTHEKTERPTEVILSVADEEAWREWLTDLGPAFRPALFCFGNPAPAPFPGRDGARFDQLRRTLEHYKWAFAFVAPRGVGPTRWEERSRFDGRLVRHQILRRYALLGQTLDGQRVFDVSRAVQCLKQVPQVREAPLTLQGKGTAAGVALYAALFRPEVAKLDLWYLPRSHRQGPTFLNVLRVLDVPQAVALAFPRKVTIHARGEDVEAWGWPMQLQDNLGGKYLEVRRVE